MVRARSCLLVSLLSFVAFGCVSNEKYTAAKLDADQYAQRLAQMEREKGEAVAARDLLQRQLANVGLTENQKDALIINQSNQINDLQNQLSDLNRRYTDAAGKVGQVVQLPVELNEALKGFATAYPDLVDYDANRGIVKFKSDVTFSPGSAVLTSGAASAIDRFSAILNSPAAQGYELMVVGHTDNVRVSHPATVAAGHKDNWYLSAHRAIAVSNELQHQGISPARLEVAGCADQRPIAPNTSEAGKAQNRRVEVLILPTTVHGSVASAPSDSGAVRTVSMKTPGRSTATPMNKDIPASNKDVPPARESNKETIPEPTRPSFNK